MRWELSTTRASAAYLGVVVLLSGLLLWTAQRHLRAHLWAAASDAAGIERAIRLEPANAESVYKLARLRLFSDQDTTQAIALLGRSTALNPHSPWPWVDLATAHRIAGDTAAQRAAIERASAVDPRTPLIAWESTNLLLVDGQLERALDRLRVVVENEPLRRIEALRLAWRAAASVDTVLGHSVPRIPAAYLAFLDVLIAERNTAESMQVWKAMVSEGVLPPPQQAGRFLEYLIREREVENAAHVWRDLVRDPGALSPDHAGRISLVDPSFEEELLSGGFQWRLEPAPSVAISSDHSVFRTGTRSMRLDFASAPVAFPGLAQYVPVEPGAAYELSVAVKADALETAHAPRWLVADAYTHEALAEGPEWERASGWRDSSLRFSVPAGTRLVALRVWRKESSTLIRGRAWVDNVRMVKR